MQKMNQLKACGAVLLVIVALWSLSGCNVGMSPEGASKADEKAMFDKLPLEERAKQLMALPGPMDDKIAKVKAMYAKEGKTMPENIGSQSGGAGKPPVPGHG